MKSSFQTIIIVVFSIAFVGAVAVFSGLFSSGRSTSSAPAGVVNVWGVLPRETMQRYASAFNAKDLGYTINYREVPADSFNQTLIVALADGKQPDLLIVTSELFSQFISKLNVIPFAQYPERAFRDANVEGADVFLTNNGTAALPLLVDPLVVFYNRDLLAGARLVSPPVTWEEFIDVLPLFNKRSASGIITQSAIALGEGANVNHARDILSALFLQTGNPIVEYEMDTGFRIAAIDDQRSEDAAVFFTSFSNPTNENYSWNRSLPPSIDQFLSGKTAFYVGRASELFTIQSQNPNLNFDVIEFFQPANAVKPVTYGSFVAAAVLNAAPNKPAAMAALGVMASDASVDDLAKRFSIPPVKKQLLRAQELDPYVSVFFRAALSAESWRDPDSVASENIFRDMIQSITSGALDAGAALKRANANIQSNIR